MGRRVGELSALIFQARHLLTQFPQAFTADLLGEGAGFEGAQVAGDGGARLAEPLFDGGAFVLAVGALLIPLVLTCSTALVRSFLSARWVMRWAITSRSRSSAGRRSWLQPFWPYLIGIADLSSQLKGLLGGAECS